MKIGIVHDYLREYGGAEKVLETLNEIWPEAPIYTSTYEASRLGRFGFKVPQGLIHTTFAQYLPFRYPLRKHYFFAYPLAFKTLKPDSEIILSSSSYASKFVNKPKSSLHICYLHSVPKFLWRYETETPDLEILPIDKYLKPIYEKILPPAKNILRKMDFKAAQKVDFFIANSNLTKDRIKKHYKLDSVVIYPPVDVERFSKPTTDHGLQFKKAVVSRPKADSFYLVISRLGAFKRIDIAVEAFNELKTPLKIIGDGQELANLKKTAHPNIEFLGTVSEEELLSYLKNCIALIFPTLEDFGIVPVEAMAAGKPVIGYRGGGILETVVEGKTGEFFDEQTPESLIRLLKKFDPSRYNPRTIRKQAAKFSKEKFKKKIKDFVEEAGQKKAAVEVIQ